MIEYQIQRYRAIQRTLGGGLARLVRLCVVVVVVVAAGAMTGCSEQESSLVSNHTATNRKAQAHERWSAIRVDVKLQLARRHLEGGRMGEAELAAREALAADAQNSEALLLIARLRLAQGQLAEAKQAIAQVLAAGHSTAEAQYLAGLVAQRYEDLSSALEHYLAAAAAESNESEYVLAVAETFVALDRPLDALELVESRLADFDGVLSVRVLAARLNQMIGLRHPAADHARAALQMVGDRDATRVELGLILMWSGQYDEGIDAVRPVVESRIGLVDSIGAAELDTTGIVTPGVLTALAEAHAAREEWEDVRRVLKPVLRADDRDEAAWCLYARASIQVGSPGDAAAALDQVLTVRPAALEPLLLRAYVALSMGDAARALESARKAVGVDEGCLAAHWLLSEAAEAAGQPAEAKRARAMILTMQPDSDLASVLVAKMSEDAVGSVGAIPIGAAPLGKTASGQDRVRGDAKLP